MRKVTKRISRFGLFVPDLSEAVKFYEQLGFQNQQELEIPSMRIAFVKLEGTVLELIQKTGEVPFHKDGVLNHITFDVNDMGQAVKEFTEAGATFFVPPMSLGSGQVAFATGANGEVIELFKA